MSVQILQTEKLALFMQLASRRTDYYVRARIFDDSDAEIAASPVALTHQIGGLYTDFSVFMPASANYVVVQYEIFSDPGFTNIVTGEAPDVDYFKRDINIAPKIDQIISKISGLALPGAAITVEIETDEIKSIISDLNQLKAEVSQTDLTAKISGENIGAKIDADEINVITNCD